MKLSNKELTAKVSQLDLDLARERQTIASLTDRIGELYDHFDKKVQTIYEGMGGAIWRTQAGHARFVALLSTPHLENVIAWERSSEFIKERCTDEIKRRNIDLSFRLSDKLAAPKSKRVRKVKALGKKSRKVKR